MRRNTMSASEEEKNLLIIDTDCGIDDAMAILLALSFSDTWEILAITCCNGNTSVDNACTNVLKVLNLCGRTDIPVYRGCEKPLVPLLPAVTVAHGGDGLGNVAHEFSEGSLKVSEGHAVNVLIKLARDHKKKVHLVALAPLTNVAIAHRLDPEFTANLKSFVFMGGNSHGVGNTTSAAEFNFAADPEAAHIVVSEVLCPTTMVPWETTLKHPIPWEFYEQWISGKTKNANFFMKTTLEIADLCREEKCSGFVACDFLAMAVALVPACVKRTEDHPVVVETMGTFTRGQTVIQRRLTLLNETKDRIILSIAIDFDNSLLMQLYESTSQFRMK